MVKLIYHITCSNKKMHYKKWFTIIFSCCAYRLRTQTESTVGVLDKTVKLLRLLLKMYKPFSVFTVTASPTSLFPTFFSPLAHKTSGWSKDSSEVGQGCRASLSCCVLWPQTAASISLQCVKETTLIKKMCCVSHNLKSQGTVSYTVLRSCECCISNLPLSLIWSCPWNIIQPEDEVSSI